MLGGRKPEVLRPKKARRHDDARQLIDQAAARGLERLNTLHHAARLEPMAECGEVLVSEALFLHPDLDKARFEFLPQQRALQPPLGDHPAGAWLRCYSVGLRDE